MRRTFRTVFSGSLWASLLLAACSGVPTKTFQIDAIDANEQPLECLVVVEEDWTGAKGKNQVVNVGGDNVLSLTIKFDRPQMDVTVSALDVDPDTHKVLRIPSLQSEATSQYKLETRRLQATDPAKQLFILPKR